MTDRLFISLRQFVSFWLLLAQSYCLRLYVMPVSTSSPCYDVIWKIAGWEWSICQFVHFYLFVDASFLVFMCFDDCEFNSTIWICHAYASLFIAYFVLFFAHNSSTCQQCNFIHWHLNFNPTYPLSSQHHLFLHVENLVIFIWSSYSWL